MSIETNTPNIRTPEQPIQPEDDFAAIEEMQRSQEAAFAARRLVNEQATTQSEVIEAAKSPTNIVRNFANGAAVTGAAAGVIIGGAHLTGQALQPEFSEETTTYTVEQGDGLLDAAEAVLGSETVNQQDIVSHIQSLPVNIDALKDGLQPGESITIPTSVEK